MTTSTEISGGNQREKSRKTELDYISDLPDCVISHILSRLPTPDAVRTSVLSKHWKLKWTSLHLILLSDCFVFHNERKKADFVHFVERALLLAQNLQTVEISCFGKYDSGCLNSLIFAALSRDVPFVYIYYRYASFILPHSLLNWNSLRKLSLNMPCTLKVPAELSFLYLTTLRLERVVILNERSSSDPVKFNFLVLKTFELMQCKWLNLKLVKIYAPKLTRFRSGTPFGYGVNDYSIKITGGNLVKFESYGVVPENIVISRGSDVVYADLRNEWRSSNIGFLELVGLQIRKLLKGLLSLRELELSSYVRKAITLSKQGVPLPKYIKMERLILSYSIGNAEELLELLHVAPFLKILEITAGGWKDHDYDAVEYVPLCIISHLEIVKFTCDAVKMPELLKLAKFLTKNAVQLRKIFFSGWKNQYPLSLKNEITKELLAYARDSTSLSIVFS